MRAEKAIVSTPSLHPVLEATIRDHAFMVSTPALFDNMVRNRLYQCQPVCVGLAEFEVTEIVLSREGSLIQESFACTQAISELFVLMPWFISMLFRVPVVSIDRGMKTLLRAI